MLNYLIYDVWYLHEIIVKRIMKEKFYFWNVHFFLMRSISFYKEQKYFRVCKNMKHLFQLNTAWKKLSKYDNSLMKSVIQYSEKYVTIGNNSAFYKSLYLLNGKKINRKMRNGFKYRKLSINFLTKNSNLKKLLDFLFKLHCHIC